MKTLSRVLVAEDDRALNHLIQKHLSKEGFRTEGSISGKDTIAMLNGRSDTMLLLDYELKDMTGRQVIDTLSKTKCSVPFIVITGQGNEKIAVEMMKLGAMDYVVKGPDFLDSVTHVIKRVDKELSYKNQLAKAEKALLQEKDRLLDITNSVNCGLLLLDDELKVIYANRVSQNLFGPLDYIKGLTCCSLFQTNNPEKECTSLKAMQTGKTVKSDTFVKGINGEDRFFYVVASPVRDSNGSIHQIIEVIVDITERKQAEKKLEMAATQWRSTFDAISNFVSLQDTELRFIRVNKALADFLGTEPKELIGKYCYKEIFSLDKPCHGCSYYEMAETGETVTKELYDSARNIYLKITTSPIFGKDGKLKGSVHYMRDVSERKRSEEVLHQSEERYRRIAGAISDYIYTVRLESGVPSKTTHIETCLAVTGYTSREFAEDTYLWIKMVVEEDQGLVRQQAEEILSGQFPHPIEHRIIRKDGRIRWVENTVVPHQDANGNLISYDGTVRDITERKQAENKLKEREEQLRLTIESSNTGMWNWDIINEKITISDKYAELLGYSPSDKDQLDLQTIISRTHPDDYPLMMEKVYDHFEQKTDSYSFESRMKTRQGCWKWFLDRGKVVERRDDGFPLKMMGTLTDISDLKQAERFIIDLLESIDEGFVVVDRNYRILLANKAFCKYANKTSREITGEYCYKITHNLDRPCHEGQEDCPVHETLKTGNPSVVYHTHYDMDANPVYMKLKSYPIKDASGEIISIIENIVDVTEEKRTESQLRHAQKMETVGQLAGGVAHDFNNILSAITNYGHVLKMKIKNAEQRHIIEQILSAAGRAANLTSDLLAFSRKKEMDMIPVNLNEILRKSKNLLSGFVNENIQIRTVLSKNNLTVTADSGQIEQVLMNLVTNSHSAMPEGGILSIATKTANIDNRYIKQHGFGKPGSYAVLTVADTGKGMDEKTSSQIFEPFFTTKNIGEGTGLGLSTVYGIIKQHNGYINVTSKPDRGTVFKIYLPLTKSKADIIEAPLHTSTSNGNETLLFAEDDVDVRKSTEEVLRGFGYNVIDAIDGEDAIIKFHQNKDRIQLLLLDVLMPKKNGKEVYDEIRRESPSMKVLFMSGYTASTIHNKGHLEKGLNFISKPVTPSAISRKIREVLDR